MKLFKVSSAYDLRRISFIKNNIDRSLFLEGKRAFHKCGADGKWHRPDKVNQKCKITNRKLLKSKKNTCQKYSDSESFFEIISPLSIRELVFCR